MMFHPKHGYPRDVPVISQTAHLQKKRCSCFSYHKRPLQILLVLFIVLTVILSTMVILTFTLPDDDQTNDFDELILFRRNLEDKIHHWNMLYLKTAEEIRNQKSMLSKPERGFIMMSVLKEISRRTQLSYRNLSSSEYHRRLFHDAIKDLCHPTKTCPTDVILSPYSSIDGSCNNLNHPHWGMTGRSQKRILRPFFDDDIGSVRTKSVDGSTLPSPRLISNVLHRPDTDNRTDTEATVMVMAFGQFFDHDLMLTPMTTASNGEPISCCTEDAKSTKGPLETCAPIDIPAVDEHFPPGSCMNFSRSAPSVCDSCDFCQREQINKMTSFIDVSQVYGATKARCDELREFRNGFLKTTYMAQNHHILLPQKSGTKTCTLSDSSQFCFNAGDDRVNVVPNLSSLHTMFVREHNRIAGRLARINPHWDDELLFQVSRKIFIALNQQIVFNEYLPTILGDDTMVKNGLKISQSAFSDVYDDMVDPRISSSFSTATFRFGHATVPNHQRSMSRNFRVIETVPIENTFRNPNMTFEYCDGVARWLVKETAVKTDGMLGDGVRNLLFHNAHHHNRSFDLASLNIQRGRDHGIAPYNYWRHFCKLPVITESDFKNTGRTMGDFTASVSDLFRQVYRHADDIDLFTGGMREMRLYNSHVGPTFACLIGKEFQRLKQGDRFYYENPPKQGLPYVGFTEDQLASVKQFRLSKIVCETMNVPRIQPNVFRPSHEISNPLQKCQDLPDIDLTLWRDEDQPMPSG